MRYLELIEKTYRFHRVVYISLTEQCPLRCRHCFVESAPERSLRAPLERFEEWMDGLMASDLEALILSGGEPFNHPQALRYALAGCNHAGKTAVVGSSGFWARTRKDAERLLDSYPPFGILLLSTDVYHEEFVPLEHVRIAAEAARDRGIEPAFQVCDGPAGETTFLEHFRTALGDELARPDNVYVTRLSILGRAENELTAEEIASSPDARPTGAQEGPCPWLGTPWLREDGVVAACPNLGVFRAPSHPLHLGNLNGEGFGALSARADGDPVIQLLRTIGPVGIARSFPVADWGWKGDVDAAANVCEVCHSLMRTPGLPERLREEADRRQLATYRMLLYGETPSLGSA